VGLLDDLIERYGTGAVVAVRPYMPDNSGEILRWVLEIDGEEASEADVRVTERDGLSVMLLVGGGEEIELTSWREGAPGPGSPPAAFLDTLGGLQRRSSTRR
jgi:hypothetical protein